MSHNDTIAAEAVLIVEDEALIRFVLAEELADLGCQVIEAANADEAVTLLRSRRGIAAVITDASMPGSMDGFGLCAWMHQHAAGIPIIVTSGYAAPADPAVINPAIRLVVSKPYRPSSLAKQVAGLVRAGSRGAVLAAPS